jgi:hypothetical protein
LKFLNLNFCKYCVFEKQCRYKFKEVRHIRKCIIDYIHSNVWGSSPTVSLGGSSYFVTFIDDYSMKVWVYLLKIKVDVFNTFKQFMALVENNIDRSIKCLRKDNGGEFTSVEFENYSKEVGIERHMTTIYTLQQNGVVERMNMTLLERVGSMLGNAKMQQELWAEAVLTTCYLINRSPSTAIICKIPEDVWTGHSCDFSNPRIFGCDAYALISKDQRSKLDLRSNKYVFVGYGDGFNGYRLWDAATHKLIIRRDVVFDESSLLKS